MSRIRAGKHAVRFGRPTKIQNYIMKLHRLFATVLATAALALPAFAAEETPLGEQMEKVSKALKAVSRAAKEGNLSLIHI